MTAPPTKIRMVRLVHALLVLAILSWWTAYFWRHSPARQVYIIAVGRLDRPDPVERMENRVDAARAAIAVSLADVAFGVLVIVSFAVGTGVYARRFETWLHFRISGQAVSLQGTGLEAQALRANADANRSVL